MKKYQTIICSGLILTIALTSILSCQKSTITSPSMQSIDSKTEFMNATNGVDNFDSTVNEDFNLILDADDALPKKKSKCYTVTYSPSRSVYPHTKTIDYGTGCTGAAGVTKRGKIIITYYTPKMEAQGRYSEITYQNYYVNNIHVEGSIKVNKSTNSSNQIVFKHIVHKTITTPEGDSKNWNSNLDWTLIQGGNTNAISDDVYQITGHSEGKETLGNVEAINWQSDVDKNNPLIKPQACKRKVQGGMIVKIKIKACKDLNEYLDYGDGSCDNRATLIINGSAPQQVTLPLRFWPLNQ